MPERIRPTLIPKPLNKVLMLMLRLGIPISRVEKPVVRTVPGRKTGKPRSTPVTPMEVDDGRYVVNGYPGAGWVDNVCAAGEVTLALGVARNGFAWWNWRLTRLGRCCGHFPPLYRPASS
jgi:hypothetical protein